MLKITFLIDRFNHIPSNCFCPWSFWRSVIWFTLILNRTIFSSVRIKLFSNSAISVPLRTLLIRKLLLTSCPGKAILCLLILFILEVVDWVCVKNIGQTQNLLVNLILAISSLEDIFKKGKNLIKISVNGWYFLNIDWIFKVAITGICFSSDGHDCN